MLDERHSKKTLKSGVIISAVLHVFLLLGIFLAARKRMEKREPKQVTVTLMPLPKSVDLPAKEPVKRPAEPPPLPTPAQRPPPQANQRLPEPTPAPNLQSPPRPLPTAPVPSTAAAPVAPPPAAIPEFDFGGGKLVETSSDAKALYKRLVEHTLRSQWKRPQNTGDLNCEAEVEVGIDSQGLIIRSQWKKESGNNAWDASVRRAIAQTKSIGRAPPAGFPGKLLIRFDVQPEATASLP